MVDNKLLAAHNNTADGEKREFDLQLFADEAEVADSVEGAGEQAQPEEQPTAPQEQEVDKETLLGGNKEQEKEGPPEKYEINLPEGAKADEVILGEFSTLASKIGLSNEAANELAGYGFSFAQKAQEAVMQERQDEINSWGEVAKKELGSKFDSTVATAGIGIEVLEKQIPNIRQVLNETGAGNRVEIIKAIAYLGELVKEDNGRGLVGASVVPSTKSMYPNTDFSKY